jgi:hypothetical protein
MLFQTKQEVSHEYGLSADKLAIIAGDRGRPYGLTMMFRGLEEDRRGGL